MLKKQYNPDIDWSGLEPAEIEPGQLISSIVHEPQNRPVQTSGGGMRLDGMKAPENNLFDPMQLFNAPIQPHRLGENS